jgi:adenylate cyclase
MNAEAPPGPAAVAGVYQVDDLLIDLGMRRVTRDGVDLWISGRSFDLLLALVRAAPNLMSTQELMESVWPRLVVGAETVTQRIMLLRQGLGDSAESPRYIVALRGHGYRMAAAVRSIAASVDSHTVSAAPPGRSLPRIRHWTTAVLALTLLLVASGLWQGLEHHRDMQVVAGMASDPASAAVPRSSVAVMPFANLTGEPSQEYLGDGMAEELINTLARVPGLKTPARTSTFAYRGRNVDIRRIGRELGVATILEGSVRSAGERLRISARLVDAATGYQIWSQDYDRRSADLFRLQDDLAGQIVQALRGYMKTDLTVPAARPPPTRDVQAYDLYLQARLIARSTVASMREAFPLVDQAIARDPDFVDARALRAMLQADYAALGAGPLTLVDAAQRDIARALALSPDSMEAHTAQGQIHIMRGRWVEAEASFRAAGIEGGDDPYTLDFLPALVTRPAGRLQQARAELLQSYHLAPTFGWTLENLATTESLLGDDAAALQFVGLSEQLGDQRAESADPGVRARAAARGGRYDEAAMWATRALPDSVRNAGGGRVMQGVYAALADPAKRPAARRALQEFVPRVIDAPDLRLAGMVFVAAFTMIGDLDGAYALADRLANRFPHAQNITLSGDVWTPEMRAFREDSRFQALMARVQLPGYWMQYGPPDGCDFTADRLTCH